jgi:hypothetical protein
MHNSAAAHGVTENFAETGLILVALDPQLPANLGPTQAAAFAVAQSL